MNKVFKVIWNHATQTWVAVSEFSKAKGKTKSKTLTTISLAVGSVLVSANSLAATADLKPIKTDASTTAGIAITNDGINNVLAGSDDPTVKPKHVIVIGDQSTRAYDETIMIGYRFTAFGYPGNAGANGKAGDTLIGNRIRVGGGANGKDSFGSALGYGAQIAGPSVAIGVGARADTLNAEGWNATTSGSVAIGDFALSGGNINGSIGIGAIATADQHNSIALGGLSGATSLFSDRDLAAESGDAGHTNHAKNYAIDESSFVALSNHRGGNPANQMISIGYKAGARSTNSIAIGINATTSRNIRQPVAGKENERGQFYGKTSEGTISIGDNTASIKQNSIALGHNATAGGYTEQDIKALNAEQTRLEDMLVTANARKTKAIAEMQAKQTAENKFALASINSTIERITVALNRIKADLTHAAANNTETTSAIAVGNEARANSTNAIALGYQAKASGVDSISVGPGNNVTGNYSGAFGEPNTVTGNQSYAFGNNNTVKADQTFVLGNKVTVESTTTDNRTGAVVLGDNSTVPTEVKAVNSAKIGTENGKKLVYSGFAGNLGRAETNGEPQKADADKQGRFVSVGNATSPRQVKFVAAGEISKTSTDAINGSQLYAFSDVVNNLAISTATIIGGNAVLNPNGTVSGFSQPLNTTTLGNTEAYTAPTTPATNVSTAITNLNNYVNAGWKIAEGDSVDAKARISPNKQVNFKADGLATVSVKENTTNNGADVTYSVQKGTFDTTTNGTVKANSTVGVVTNADVATAVNNSGWNTTLSTGDTLNVNPGDQVNYVNGNGTTANVTKAKDANGNDVVSVSYNVNQTKGSVNTNGTVSVVDGNSFLNASTVANLVNNASFNVSTKAVDKFAAQTTKTAQVKAGGNVTYIAGKNIAIEQDNQNFTFSTTENVVFNNAQVNTTLTIGNDTSTNPKVNITSTTSGLVLANGSTSAPVAINNVQSFLPGTAGYTGTALNTDTATSVTAPTLTTENKARAATIDDVVNTGWNLRGQKAANGAVEAVDFVKPYDTVVFKSGNNATTDVVTTTDDNKVSTITITAKAEPVKTSATTVNNNGTVSVATGEDGTNLVNATTVANAINKAGWNTTLSTGDTLNVNPGDQVNYVNGNGTKANVTTKTVDGKDVVSVSYNVNQTKGSVNTNGTVSVVDGNSFLNASTVANLVNNAAFNVTTAKVDAFAENQEGKANATVKAGGNITYTAGKNIAISQNGSNFTFSTTKDIEVDSVTANNRVQIGSGDTAVNLTTDLGALKVADKDGNATQITNVEAGTNVMAFNKEGDQLVQVGDKYYVVDPETNEVDFTKESTPATEEELDELAKAKPELKADVAYSKAASGLADLDNSEQTNALTVADAQRLGWVVSASGNDYADSVTNANEVRFNGSNGISVTGETDEHGVRNINVSIAKGNVAGNTTTGVATGDTNYVTGDQVANAINNSGWKTTATKVVDEAGNEIVDANKATAVNPGDSVNYVDGNSTKANVVVTKAADGKETVNVSYDLVTEDHLTPVANNAKSVTKPTNIDAKGKDAATVNDVLNAGWNLQANDEAVDAVTHGNNVNFTSKDGSVKITAKSDGSTSSLDFAVNATSIVNQVAGTISYNKDGKATTNGDGKRIATVGDVANTINNTGWLTNVTDAKGNVTTKVVTPNTQVNYVNGDGTKANVVANSTTRGLDVTFNVKSANPETLTVDGNGVKVNTGSITEATDVAGDANRGKVTVAAGEGNKVATVQNVANAINSASWTVKVADTQEEITTSTANDAGSSVRAGNEITHVAGKNLKVKRDGRNVTYALANDVSVNTVTAQNSIKVGAGNAATTVTTSSAQDGVTEVKLADAAGKATRITNVAAGVKDTDAVNVSQLRNSNAQINQNIAHLNNKVNRMGKDLRAGIAGSNAAAGLPQVYIPGKSMVAAAAGTFKGQSAVAVGYSRASDNGKVILKLQGNANTRGDVGGSVGVGYQW